MGAKAPASGGLCVSKFQLIKSNQGNMAQSFECLLCKHSFSSVDDPKLKILSFFLFVFAIVLLFTALPLGILLFGMIWFGNLPKCPRCRSRKLLRLGKSEKTSENNKTPTSVLEKTPIRQSSGGMNTFLKWTIVFVIASLGYLGFMALSAPPSPPKPTSLYTTSEDALKVVIDEEKGYEMLDVYYAIGRLIERPLSDYPFYAFKDPQGGGYFGIFLVKSPSGNLDGEVIFLVSEKALNQTKLEDLEKSIRYVNGLASDFADRDLARATGYSTLEVLELISN